MYQNATREDIVRALSSGRSVSAIGRDLRADRARIRRIRDELGLAAYVPAARLQTLEEKWAESARRVDGGHVEWTGGRGTRGGTPVMRYRERSHSPAAVAFRIRTGRDAQGRTFADCGFNHCVAPSHVQDEVERAAARAAARTRPEPAACRYGHAHTEHGRYAPDGTAYCQRCNWLAQHPEHDDRIRRTRPQTPQEAFQQQIEEVEGGHVQWTGPSHRGTPGLPWQGTTLSPLRLGFSLHHGRDPEGHVTSTCPVPLCVAGPCLKDRPMREAARKAERKVDRLYASIFGTAA
ncbi:hypothetical protein ACFQ0X_44105 [Streptomyces rectiviolaceus]|uniref:Uncharacterized protein n=1 Tax=Streptomyces rectiviolaceus TaxID=332591 RepID=A0ABP6NRB9_9ACTN